MGTNQKKRRRGHLFSSHIPNIDSFVGRGDLSDGSRWVWFLQTNQHHNVVNESMIASSRKMIYFQQGSTHQTQFPAAKSRGYGQDGAWKYSLRDHTTNGRWTTKKLHFLRVSQYLSFWTILRPCSSNWFWPPAKHAWFISPLGSFLHFMVLTCLVFLCLSSFRTLL